MRTFSPRLRASAALLVATGAVASLGAISTSAYAATPTSSSASSALNNRAESLAEQAFAAATNTGSSNTGSTASSTGSSSAASLAQGAYNQIAGSNSSSSASTGSSSSSDASTSSSASYSGSAQSIAAQIVPADQLASFDQIISHESGWDVTATNPSSGAYGLAQSLPGDKMASAGSDWQTNPATQIRWALDYMNSTYGSPNQAWSFWQSHNWY